MCNIVWRFLAVNPVWHDLSLESSAFASMWGRKCFAPACCTGRIAQIRQMHTMWYESDTKPEGTHCSGSRSALQTCEVAGGGAGLYMYRQRLEPKVWVNQCGITCIRYCYCRQRILCKVTHRYLSILVSCTFSEPVLWNSLSPYCSSETRSLEVKGQQGSCSGGLQCSSAQGVLSVFCFGHVKFCRQHQGWHSDRDEGHMYFNVF